MSEKREAPWAFRTKDEALEHIVIMLERGERVPYWAITDARALLAAPASADDAGRESQ